MAVTGDLSGRQAGLWLHVGCEGYLGASSNERFLGVHSQHLSEKDATQANLPREDGV